MESQQHGLMYWRIMPVINRKQKIVLPKFRIISCPTIKIPKQLADRIKKNIENKKKNASTRKRIN